MLDKNKIKNKNKEDTLKSAQKSGKKINFKEFIVKKPGFLIAIFAVIVIILILIFIQYDPAISQQKIDYAQQFFESNQSDLNTYLQSVVDEQANEQATTLDESYLSSTKADIEWMIAKEKELYNSHPSNEVYPKEAAFTLFAQKIVAVNDEYSYSLENDNYDVIIAQGNAVDFNAPQLLTSDELNQAFTNQDEIIVYTNALNQLYFDYINSKKQFIKNITSKERQYVEAKKIILLAEQDANY